MYKRLDKKLEKWPNKRTNNKIKLYGEAVIDFAIVKCCVCLSGARCRCSKIELSQSQTTDSAIYPFPLDDNEEHFLQDCSTHIY
jgi:hypothetical protein